MITAELSEDHEKKMWQYDKVNTNKSWEKKKTFLFFWFLYRVD